MLVEGRWEERPLVRTSREGRFERAESTFRDWLEGTRGAPEGRRWPVDANRYRLYVAWACPWAHRTLLTRALYGLEDALPVAIVAPQMMTDGWVFSDTHPDPFEGHAALRDLYVQADPTCTCKVTVPVLWDSLEHTIVNNESSELVRMFAGPLARVGRPDAPLAGHDLRPIHLEAELDAVNDRIYNTVNNGVYKAGFAASQAAYDEAVTELFDTLDWLEQRLSRQRWLVGNVFTEADLRLFPTMVRFDVVYHGHFKCNRNRLTDFPALFAWTRDIARIPGVRGTFNLPETRHHYYFSHRSINPTGIVPVGPTVDFFSAPPNRSRLGPFPGERQ